jgi:DNA end-binding protein Ku
MAKAKRKREEPREAPQEQQEHVPRGVRPFWSGTISFGLVSVPVNLFPATRRLRAGLRLLDADGTPLARRFFCPAEGREVHSEHVLRGYEVDDGEVVIVHDDELESLQPRKSRDIDLQRFVDLEQVPPILFERAYFLTPAGDSTKAYRLLADVMERSGKAGIATFVMRDKEYLVAILAQRGILRAQTLRFEDEIRSPEEVGLPEPAKPAKAATARYAEAIADLSVDALPKEDLKDEFEKRLQELVERKRAQGKDVVEAEEYQPAEQGEEADSIDLLETIRQSLQGARGTAAEDTGGEQSGQKSGDDLADASKEELYDRAAKMAISGRSRMTKSQLLRAIRRRA